MKSNLSKKGVDLNVCAYCSTPINDFSRTVDHLYPKSEGGILSNDNKVPACKNCNELKANQDPKTFLKTIESLLFFETKQNKEKISYLKRIRYNVTQLIASKNGK